ncbi:MAG TPA: hypothetical protein VFV92_09230 [Candidatus Bathyarchaeia archaeon]|nr:hypothetical protein [Candidatus Bathyarchaeia archaeon]
MQGLAVGGSIGGLYGAGGGLIIGLVVGLFTTDAHYAQINAQVQVEQAKDRELEAKIEQELQRQRELDAQLTNTAGTPLPGKAVEPQPVNTPADAKTTRVVSKDPSGPTQNSTSTSAVASLNNRKENLSNSPSPFKNVEVRDTNGDGIADLWIYYNPIKPGGSRRRNRQ